MSFRILALASLLPFVYSCSAAKEVAHYDRTAMVEPFVVYDATFYAEPALREAAELAIDLWQEATGKSLALKPSGIPIL